MLVSSSKNESLSSRALCCSSISFFSPSSCVCFFFQAEDGIRDDLVTGVQTCALPILYQLYARIAPKPDDWPALITKLGELLRQDYDWSKDVAAIKAPTLLVFGDADAVRTAHTEQFFELFGGGKKDGAWDGSGISNARLAILPGLTHYTIFSSPALASTVAPFLDAAMPGGR